MHIGLLCLPEIFQNNGRSVVNKQFEKALIDYATNHKITILNPLTFTEKQISKILKECPLDVLHHQGPDIFRAMEYKRLNPKPMVVTGITHSLGSDPYLQWLYMTLFARPKESDCLFCTSEQAKLAISKMQQGLSINLNLVIQKLGIFTEEFKFNENKESNHKINILYFGRLSPLTKCNLLPVIDMVCEAQKSSNKKNKINNRWLWSFVC